MLLPRTKMELWSCVGDKNRMQTLSMQACKHYIRLRAILLHSVKFTLLRCVLHCRQASKWQAPNSSLVPWRRSWGRGISRGHSTNSWGECVRPPSVSLLASICPFFALTTGRCSVITILGVKVFGCVCVGKMVWLSFGCMCVGKVGFYIGIVVMNFSLC